MVRMCVCVIASISSKVMDQPGMVADPACGQPNKKNSFPCLRPRMITTRVYFEMSLFPSIFLLYHFRFLLLIVWRVRRTFFSFRMVFFYLVTTGCIFYISLCENSINHKFGLAGQV